MQGCAAPFNPVDETGERLGLQGVRRKYSRIIDNLEDAFVTNWKKFIFREIKFVDFDSSFFKLLVGKHYLNRNYDLVMM